MSHVILDGATPQAIATVRGPAPHSIAVSPGPGCTVSCEVSLGGNRWYPWDAGPVTEPTIRVVNGPIRQVRFTRTAGTDATSVGEIF